MEITDKRINSWKANFVDNIGDILVIYDRQYKHVYVNEVTVRESGVTAKEMLGRSNRDLKIPSDLKEVKAREDKIDEVFATGRPTDYATFHTFSSGNTEYYHTRFIPETYNLDNVIYVYALTRNITKQVIYEEKFKKSLKRLKEKNKELDTVNKYLDNFVHVIAHDLKNPLNNIQQLIQFYESESDEGNKSKYLNLIKGSFKRLENTVLSLIEVVSSKDTDNSLAKIIVFENIFNNILADLEQEVTKCGGKIIADFQEKEINYMEGYLFSIMKNLISNSLKYHHLDRPLMLEVSTYKEEKYTLLIVKDNGIGINLPLYSGKLFMPFRRFTKQAEGKGIGLSIIKTMIEKNGGRIEVESKVNEGTTFKVYMREYN